MDYEKNFTIHRIAAGDYTINAAVLAFAETMRQALQLAALLRPVSRYGVALWDHEEEIIYFGAGKDSETGYRPAQPVSKVRIEPIVQLTKSRRSSRMKTNGSVKTERFTIHLIDTNEEGYAISAAVLASAATKEEAEEIGSILGSTWYDGVAIWDHQTDIVDFGGVEDEETGYEPIQPASKVWLLEPSWEILD
jgi:hypothetical protein